jgi:hypothetical protein
MWHSYIARDVEREESNALRWGNYVHEALEKHINGSEALPDNLQHYRHLYTFPAGYDVEAELMLGMREDGSPCTFFADDVWLRGKIDVVVTPELRPTYAILIDHKTGKSKREDPYELELHAALLKAHRPQLTSIKGWYNWLHYNKMGMVHDLSDTAAVLDGIRWTRQAIEHAFSLGAEAFPPRQSGLCPYCPVKACEFHP